MCFLEQCVVVGNLRNCYYGEFSRLGSQAIPDILFWGRGKKIMWKPRGYRDRYEERIFRGSRSAHMLRLDVAFSYHIRSEIAQWRI